jgi:general secretion pathway protein M
MSRLSVWYAALQPREQRMVSFGGAGLVVLVLLFGLLLPLQSATSSAVSRVGQKREDLAWMQANQAEVRAAANAVPADTGEAPVVLVDRVARESGLKDALRGTQPSNVTGVRVQLEGAAFDTMVVWLGTLEQRYGFAVESINVDRAAKPGLVNASLTITQPRH